MLPVSISNMLASGITPCFSEARGVAPATISPSVRVTAAELIFSPNFWNVDISPAHEKRNTLAASAGLTKFLPIPPKSCFTTTIAKKAPTTGIQSGTATGRFIARSSPVTAAERSDTVTDLCSRNCVRASKPTAAATDITPITSARVPNTYTPHMNAGMSAISTSSITVAVVSGLFICGEDCTFNNGGMEKRGFVSVVCTF